jgi:hypothetical protein
MKRILIIALLVATASVAPLIFPIAESGRSSMNVLAEVALLPAAVILLLTVGLLHRAHHPLAVISTAGLAAGAVATLALEAVRLPGFWLGFMPGNLPQLMGVLLLNQFATGLTVGSNIVGWAYHFWNGASFGLIYALVFGSCRRWAGPVFGVLIGVVFMLSPVVESLGVGYFGLGYSKGFSVTVTLAHLAFGLVLGWLTAAWAGFIESPLLETVRACIPGKLAAHRSLE